MKILAALIVAMTASVIQASITLDISRNSDLFSESQNSNIFNLNVILENNSEVLLKKKLPRNNQLLITNLEGNEFILTIEFNSLIKGKIKNIYFLELLEPGFYKILIGKNNKNNKNIKSPFFKKYSSKYGYGIVNINFISQDANSISSLNEAGAYSLKSALRNLTLLFEQGVIGESEYLERRQETIAQSSK